MSVLIGAVMLATAAILILIGRPNRAGEHPRFLRFESAVVLYPPIVLLFTALGAVALISGLLSR